MEKPPHRRMIPESFVHLLYAYLEARGIDPEWVLRTPRPQASPDSPGSFPIGRWIALLDRAAAHLGDPALGLRLGQHVTPRHAGVLGYVLLASRNLEEAPQRLVTTSRRWSTGRAAAMSTWSGASNRAAPARWSMKPRSPR